MSTTDALQGKSMATETQGSFRKPLMLLIMLNLVLLGLRLWPWDGIMSLPGTTTGIDPLITLLGYLGLAYWVGSASQPDSRKALFSAAILGIVGGALLVGQVLLAAQPAPEGGTPPMVAQYSLMAAAVLVWGFAGRRAAKSGHAAGFSVLCAIWSSMVSCLIASAVALGGMYFSVMPAESSDPWKQYEGLAIGSEATQSLVRTLTTATGYLLLGPIVACVAGLLLANTVRRKDLEIS